MMKRNSMISAIVLTTLVCAAPTFSAMAKTKAEAKPAAAAMEVAPPDKPEDLQARIAETQKQVDELQQQKTSIEQQKAALDTQLKENTAALAEKKKQVDALKSKKKKK